MKKKKKFINVLIVISMIIISIVFLVRHFHIPDFCIIKEDVLYISGQPRGMDYTRLLYNYHIATIVNIRPSTEHFKRNWRNEELVWTKNNAVNYFELPIERETYFPDEQTQQQFLEVMADKNNLPVLLHGYGDDKRVAMLVAVWLEKSQGYNYDQTCKIIKKIIDDRKLTEEEKNFILFLEKKTPP
jgi:protein tyrosine/serine phosphatase